MEKQRFVEYFLCDALRLAEHFAKVHGGKISEGIGDTSLFPCPPKYDVKSNDIRFLRVEGEKCFEIGFISQDDPPAEASKHRNKYIHRVLVGEELRRARLKSGMSINEVADRSGYRPHTLEMVEQGRYDFDIAQLGTVLDAIGARVSITLDEEE